MKNRIYSIICLLLSVLNADAVQSYDFMVGNIYFRKITDSTCNVAAKDNRNNSDAYIGKIVIPPSVVYEGNTLEITGIEPFAFSGCGQLTGIIMPETIQTIGYNAFKGCGQLTEVTMPETIQSIGSGAFYGCAGIKAITIPSNTTEIGAGCFYECRNLTSVIWKAKNCNYESNSTYPYLFSGQCPLTEFYIEEGVESLPDYILRSQSDIKELSIPESVKTIGKYAFCGCTGLKSLRIPDNVEVINERVLSGINVETLVLGKKVRYIDENNNFSVSKFFKIYAENPPVIVDRTKHTVGTTLILVPYNKLEEYKHEWIDYYPSYLGYKYLPIVDADICFYDQATLQDYLVETEKYDMDTITSVAFYNGKDDYLTDKWLRTGMNPNCLFYVYPDDIMTGDNVVNISNSTAENIVLHDGYSFRCPTAFNAKNISFSYTPNVWADGKKGWDAICLPFRVSQFRASTKGALSPILLGTDGNFWLREFIGASSDELYFTSTYDGVMKAYTPYIVAFPGSKMGKNNIEGQSVSFISKDVVVGADQPAIVQRNDFIFKGGFDTDADEGTGWILNSNGDGFEKTDVVGNNPFHAYFMTDNDDTAAGAKSLSISTEFFEEEGTLVSTVKEAEEELEVVAEEGAVIIKANNNTTANIYGANGALLRCVRVNPGENRVEGLAKGLYIINKQKILIR